MMPASATQGGHNYANIGYKKSKNVVLPDFQPVKFQVICASSNTTLSTTLSDFEGHVTNCQFRAKYKRMATSIAL